MGQAAVSTVSPGDTIEVSEKECTAALPAGGVIRFNETFTLYLDESASYVAPCRNHTVFDPCDADSSSTILNTPDPFYSSMSPQVYALATATVVSYVLLILIFITPRTFYVNGPGGRSGSVGHATGFRTLLPGAGGRNTGAIGIGRRPLLQKIAALTVVASLTIATADTFKVAEAQYASGLVNSKELITSVVNSEEIRVTRVISDTFLWLAQVQTLIRLFPRHKEKVTIKWLGFGLVLFDTVFSILENFVNPSLTSKPGTFTDAIPTLSYLFELSIGLIYASCVFYYALSKRRFAFWHARMRNVCLVALISIIAVLIPVVFFITDLAQPDIATWGEYIRWVGAAAASIVVWEWVERIEALERDEKKDGILGREIFDGDEMFETTPTEDGFDSGGSGRSRSRDAKKSSRFWKNVRDLNIDFQPKIPLKRMLKDKKLANAEKVEQSTDNAPSKTNHESVARPPNAITPISRSDTNSAASTVYAVRYHDIFSPSPAIPEEMAVGERRAKSPVNPLPPISDDTTLTNSTGTATNAGSDSQSDSKQAMSTGRQIWQGVGNPFKRKRTEPPAEVAAQIAESNSRRSPAGGSLKLRNRIDAFTASQRAKFGARSQKNKSPLAVTFIPAQPRSSRANIETETGNDEAESTTSAQQDENESETDSDAEHPGLLELPVTVIPAPVRGGRAWSPMIWTMEK